MDSVAIAVLVVMLRECCDVPITERIAVVAVSKSIFLIFVLVIRPFPIPSRSSWTFHGGTG